MTPAARPPAATAPALRVLTPAVPPPPPAPDNPNWHQQFPCRSYIELAAESSAAPAARYRLRDDLARWRLRVDTDDAELVSAELVANAVTATNGATWQLARPPVRLWAIGGGGTLYILTWDATILAPQPAQPGAWDDSGRGLQIIDALAHWGYSYPPGEQAGKVVWARLPKLFREGHS